MQMQDPHNEKVDVDRIFSCDQHRVLEGIHMELSDQSNKSEIDEL